MHVEGFHAHGCRLNVEQCSGVGCRLKDVDCRLQVVGFVEDDVLIVDICRLKHKA